MKLVKVPPPQTPRALADDPRKEDWAASGAPLIGPPRRDEHWTLAREIDRAEAFLATCPRIGAATARAAGNEARAPKYWPGERYGILTGAIERDVRPVSVPSLDIAIIGGEKPPPSARVVFLEPHRNPPWAEIESAVARNADVIVAPEWAFAPERDHETFRRTIDRLRELSHGRLLVPGSFSLVDRRERQRNLAIAIADGHVLSVYAKRTNGGDSLRAKEHHARWEPGHRPGIFEWRDMRIGVEVCVDHRVGRLKFDTVRDPGEPLAMHIIVSHGMTFEPQQVATGDGGLAILADSGGNREANGVYRFRGGDLAREAFTSDGAVRTTEFRAS